jgi:hypothetical protein
MSGHVALGEELNTLDTRNMRSPLVYCGALLKPTVRGVRTFGMGVTTNAVAAAKPWMVNVWLMDADLLSVLECCKLSLRVAEIVSDAVMVTSVVPDSVRECCKERVLVISELHDVVVVKVVVAL